MFPITPEEEKTLFSKVKDFDESRVDRAEANEKRAWIIAFSAVGLAVLAIIGLVVVACTRQVFPFVVRQDNARGTVDIVSGITNSKMTYDEAINKYFLRTYVRSWQGYNFSQAQEFYDTVDALSSSEIQNEWKKEYDPKNPKSLVATYGDRAKIIIEENSPRIIRYDKDTGETVAAVDFIKTVKYANGSAPQVSKWVATLTFIYDGMPMNESKRALNPLGFKITERRIDPNQGN